MKNRIKKKIAKNKRREVLELLDLAMRKNEGNDSVFFSFSGHINGITVDIHKGGWFRGSKPSCVMTAYLDDCFGKNTLKEMKRELEAL